MGLSHDVQDDEIISLFQHGKSISDISRELDTTYDAVKYKLIRNGLLIYRDHKFVAAKSQHTSIQNVVDEIAFLAKHLADGPDRGANLRRIMKLSIAFGDNISAGFEVYIQAKQIRDGFGSYQELMNSVKRLYGEETGVKDHDFAEMY
jgi:hypothetical protein